MHAIYDCIKDRKVGIFESPTGTTWPAALHSGPFV